MNKLYRNMCLELLVAHANTNTLCIRLQPKYYIYVFVIQTNSNAVDLLTVINIFYVFLLARTRTETYICLQRINFE
jgi:hypothetical protein